MKGILEIRIIPKMDKGYSSTNGKPFFDWRTSFSIKTYSMNDQEIIIRICFVILRIDFCNSLESYSPRPEPESYS